MMFWFNLQMVHVGIATWCCLLALGIGSGLPDLSKGKEKTNQTKKHSLFLHAPKYSSNISSFENTSTFGTPVTSTITQHETTSTTTVPPLHGPTKSQSNKPTVRSGVFKNITRKSSTVQAKIKESVPETFLVPIQHLQQRFMRVKHGPPNSAHTTSKFIVKVLTDKSERRKKYYLSRNHTMFNQTVTLHDGVALNRSRQHSRKKIVSIGIPASSHLVGSTRTMTYSRTSTVKTTTGVPPESDEYYSSYAEYPDFPVNSYNRSEYREGGIIPEPDLNSEDELDEPEPDALIPDDSLADTDLHDHDLIDSVMYIYFGASDRDEGGVGKQVSLRRENQSEVNSYPILQSNKQSQEVQVLIVGAVIALVAQFVTLACVFRRLRTRPDDYASLIILNAEVASAVSNLTFMLGIQATGDRSHCLLVAVTLHYLHLVTCSWYFVNCVNVYRHVHNPEHRTKIRLYCILAWISPAVVVMICFLLNQRGYEIRSYCWMSLEKGMLFSFMIPISILILLNTLFAVMGLREVSMSKLASDSDRKSLRVAATLLPMFSVVWFLGVVALENSVSLVFPFLFVTTNGFMNWFIFACWLPPDLSVWKESDDEYDDDDDDMYDEIPGLLKNQNSINDVQPLLDDSVYVCGRRDVCELQMDPICTISS